MVNFFVKKIRAGEINQNTGLVWKVEDVHKVWRSKVVQELQNERERNEKE